MFIIRDVDSPRQLLSFGSVPLKVYLPNGDVDISIFTADNEATVVQDVANLLAANSAINLLSMVDQDRVAVRVMKYVINRIPVDFSVNQVFYQSIPLTQQFGGACSLALFDRFDRRFGNDHCFKRAFLLFKAWCYYESRILGANSALFAAYALETLMLAVCNTLSQTLSKPVEVDCAPLLLLYRRPSCAVCRFMVHSIGNNTACRYLGRFSSTTPFGGVRLSTPSPILRGFLTAQRAPSDVGQLVRTLC